MRSIIIFMLALCWPGWVEVSGATETNIVQHGELVLFKKPLLEFDSPKRIQCRGLFDAHAGQDVPDLRDFRDFFCQGRYQMTLDGPKGRTVTLFGDFNYGKERGFLVVVKKDDRQVWLVDLEAFPPDKWHTGKTRANYGEFDVFYHAAPQFSQNIASIKWGKWWKGDDPR